MHADGVHMVLMVSNQNYAGFGHIAYYWSPDWGDTWIGHPDNPIIAPGQFPNGVPPEGFQRTPTLLIDEEYNRYILAYNAGHDVNQKWKRRTYIAFASRPANNPPDTPTIEGPTSVKPGIYNYTICSTDPEGNDVYYCINKSDGNIEWIGPFFSGIKISTPITWYKKGTYTISVKAKDIFGNESHWGILEVTVPKSTLFLFNYPLLSLLLDRFPQAFPLLRYFIEIL